jgi:hypothetical protein
MVRLTRVMSPAVVVAVLEAEEPVGFIALIMGGFKGTATREVMEVLVSAIRFQGVQFTTVVAVVAGATTTTSLQRIQMD